MSDNPPKVTCHPEAPRGLLNQLAKRQQTNNE
jgi:hypothetical protein